MYRIGCPIIQTGCDYSSEIYTGYNATWPLTAPKYQTLCFQFPDNLLETIHRSYHTSAT